MGLGLMAMRITALGLAPSLPLHQEMATSTAILGLALGWKMRWPAWPWGRAAEVGLGHYQEMHTSIAAHNLL